LRVYNGGALSGQTKIGGGSVTIDNGANAHGSFDFTGSNGTLEIASTQMPTGVISGFAPGDVIDLAVIPYQTTESVTIAPGNVLKVTTTSAVYKLQLDPTQAFSSDVMLSRDASGTTAITLTSAPETWIAPP